jgi:hypothetical protein
VLSTCEVCRSIAHVVLLTDETMACALCAKLPYTAGIAKDLCGPRKPTRVNLFLAKQSLDHPWLLEKRGNHD